MTNDNNESWFDPEATTFGERVALARQHANMSQADLAKRLQVKLKTLRAWEDDQSEPRANKLSMMAGLLNVSLLWLLSGEYDGVRVSDEMTDDQLRVYDLLSELASLNRQITAKQAQILASMLQDALDSEILQNEEHEPTAPKMFHAGVFLQCENRAELKNLERAALQFAGYVGYETEKEHLKAS